MKTLAEIDPEWAWSPFEPTGEESWTRRHAAHLHRRGGLGAPLEDLDKSLRLGPSRALEAMTEQGTDFATWQDSIDQLARATIATGDCRQLSAWWVYRLLSTPETLREKATLFWHGHFATSAAKVVQPQLMFEQNELLRTYALGDFGKLVHEISRDPAMLIWLDSATNRKAHPNENYAREVMELFCLGEGQYTETDIRELARCFTGWEVKRGKFKLNPYQYDVGTKTILGQTGDFDGEAGVDIVLEQTALPDFIVRKLIRFYLFDEPEPPAALVAPLAQQFRQEGLQVEPVVRRMLTSNLFYSEHAIGRQVRSPVDATIGTLRALSATTDSRAVAQGLSSIGQDLFYPPNVKGWDGGRSWINSSTLLGRANLMRQILDHDKTRFASGTLADLADRQRLRGGDAIADWMETVVLAVPLPKDIHQHLARRIDSGTGSRDQRLRDTLHLISSLPEYQLS